MMDHYRIGRGTQKESWLVTFIKGGPTGSSLCEKMLFTSDARAPYMQIVESSASMATGSKTLSKGFKFVSWLFFFYF